MGFFNSITHPFKSGFTSLANTISKPMKGLLHIGETAGKRLGKTADTGLSMIENLAGGVGDIGSGIGNLGKYLPIIIAGGGAIVLVSMMRKT